MFNDSKNEGSFLIDRLFGNDAEATRILLKGDFADVERYITEFSFGEVYMRDGLNLEVREIITLTVLIAIGASKGQLRMHIKSLLKLGLSKKDVAEVIIQTLPNVGFPKVLDAIGVAKTIFSE